MAELTDKQQRFVEEYLIDLNATQAAIRAGYAESGARQEGARLLTNVVIEGAIAEALKARSERTQIDADWILKRLALEADADLADLYDAQGALKPITEWPKIWRQGLVAGMETQELCVGEGEEKRPFASIRKVKLSDRIRRIELLGKHVAVGAFAERMEHTGKNGAPIELQLEDKDLAREVAFLLTTGLQAQEKTH